MPDSIPLKALFQLKAEGDFATKLRLSLLITEDTLKQLQKNLDEHPEKSTYVCCEIPSENAQIFLEVFRPKAVGVSELVYTNHLKEPYWSTTHVTLP